MSHVYEYLKKRLDQEGLENYNKITPKCNVSHAYLAHERFKSSMKSQTISKCPKRDKSTNQKRDLQEEIIVVEIRRIREEIRDLIFEIEIRTKNKLNERLDQLEKRFLSKEG